MFYVIYNSSFTKVQLYLNKITHTKSHTIDRIPNTKKEFCIGIQKIFQNVAKN